jgi:DNA repair protein RecO (recombination protein O)
MSRTAVYSALVLRNRPSGESNSEVYLLTAEEGIIRATVFGGPKSKLRAHSAPYNSGQVWIYRDKAKDYSKLSDFDVHSWRPGLRELYERTMAAGGIAETILSTHGGGGDWPAALKLAESTLDALENSQDWLCSCLLVHFLWRWARFLGIQPHLDNCAVCGAGFAPDSPLWFNISESAAFCADCALKTGSIHGNAGLVPFPRNGSVPIIPGFIYLNSGCRNWLAAVENLDPSLLNSYSIDNKSFSGAKSLAFSVMTLAIGKKLASWDW